MTMEAPTKSTDRRAAYIGSLRDLAEFFEANPALPVPDIGPRIGVYTRGENFAAAVSALGGNRIKKTDSDLFFEVERQIGDAVVTVYTTRGQVCEQVQDGTETVEVEEVVTPAVTRTVTVERPVMKWVCTDSVLARREDQVA